MSAAIVKELWERSRKMQTECPTDIDVMRKRMGAREQNASIAIYGYVDVGATTDMLFYIERASLKEDYDLATLVKMTADWMGFVAERIPRYYRFHETSELTFQALEALKVCLTRQEAHQVLQALQHYYSQLKFWIDLVIPWSPIGFAYANAVGDPEPVE